MTILEASWNFVYLKTTNRKFKSRRKQTCHQSINRIDWSGVYLHKNVSWRFHNRHWHYIIEMKCMDSTCMMKQVAKLFRVKTINMVQWQFQCTKTEKDHFITFVLFQTHLKCRPIHEQKNFEHEKSESILKTIKHLFTSFKSLISYLFIY